jgi:hypothetical protein
MIAIGFGLLALFSVLSILLGSEDPRREDPKMRFGSGCATSSGNRRT